MHWKVLSSAYLTRHSFFTARKDKCEKPDGNIVDEYYVVELPPTACAFPITENGDVVMIRQYRHPIAEVILELPGGFLDPDESPENAMLRELLEETGYEFSQVKQVGNIAANPGVLNNFTTLFLAEGGRKVAGQQLDHNEEIEVVTMPLAELKHLFLQNKIPQALHAMCIFYALREMGEL